LLCIGSCCLRWYHISLASGSRGELWAGVPVRSHPKGTGSHQKLPILSQSPWFVHLKELEESTLRESSKQSLPKPETSPAPCDVIGWRILWFHHIKSPKKKRDIVAWSRELRLTGACKPGWCPSVLCSSGWRLFALIFVISHRNMSGFPGLMYFEGSIDACTEMVARLKGLQWYSLSVVCFFGLPCSPTSCFLSQASDCVAR
jgi:hypothetical protein